MVLGRFIGGAKQQLRESKQGLYEGAGSLRKGVTDTITGSRSFIGETALGIADVTGQITTGAITTVAPVTQGIQDAPGRVLGGVTAPIGDLSKDILPLVAVAGAILLLR